MTIRRMAVGAFALMLGLGAGIGSYTFLYAHGWSYLTDNPSACANCHVMRDHYDGWLKSSHRSVATCNDCHTPVNFFAKYYTKADHGFWHSYAFTTGDFHEPVQIKARSRAVSEDACRHCHQSVVHAIEAIQGSREKLSCIRCHGAVGHPQ